MLSGSSLSLPEELEQEFRREVIRLEEEQQMPSRQACRMAEWTDMQRR